MLLVVGILVNDNSDDSNVASRLGASAEPGRFEGG